MIIQDQPGLLQIGNHPAAEVTWGGVLRASIQVGSLEARSVFAGWLGVSVFVPWWGASAFAVWMGCAALCPGSRLRGSPLPRLHLCPLSRFALGPSTRKGGLPFRE